MTSRWLCLSLMSLGLSGCGDSHPRLYFALNHSFLQGSSLAVPASGVRAMTDPPSLRDIKSGDGSAFQLEFATADIADIRLELGGGLRCEDVEDELPEGTGCVQSGDAPGTVTLAGPFSIDLGTGEPWNDVKGPRVPPGIYRRVDFVLGKNGLNAHTRLTQDSRGWDMNLTLPEGTALGFETAYDLTLEEGGSLRVMFNQDAWLKELPLGTCFQSGELPRTDSELRLDEARGECQGAGDRVRDTIRTRISLQSRTF
ncbi:hypothetical protein HRD49_16140 [Corallococcus exiguus]|uniref:hypothetical protein n=1 Tax=Corallococcus TaxID=83461 RepID=UPI0011E5EB0C|nr:MULTISPECIES: hypothetical protein [Corallococcus]NNC15745.1 hypothetical protein [Corallococcus exiguus]NRD56231.1 hypothetical protein [Corallococcus exiguus]NRD63282.1 hypothetical protein [Corallococcus exiguus]